MRLSVSHLPARDRLLVRAAVVLLVAGLFELAGDATRLFTAIDDSGVGTADVVADAIGLLSRLPALAAVAIALAAFRARGEVRSHRLGQAFLFAFFGFGLDFLSRVLDLAAADVPGPEGYRVGLAAGVASSFLLASAALLASTAFSDGSDLEVRETKLKRAALTVGIGFLFSAISAFELARAFASYPDHNQFVGGLVYQGLGGVGAMLALMLGAGAFGKQESNAAWPGSRERRLFEAAVAFGFAYLVIAIGEGGSAAGTTAIGYSQSAAAAAWIFAISRCFYSAAVLCAALGFRRAAEQLD